MIMTSPEATVVRHRDFTLSPEPITFDIAPDRFECVPEIPLDVLADLADAATQRADGDKLTTAQQMDKVKDLFDGVMQIDSAARFRARTRRGTREEPNPNPIGMRHIKDILPWLMEVYGLRPTRPSDESPDGSDETESNSMDTASSTVSISSDFASIES